MDAIRLSFLLGTLDTKSTVYAARGNALVLSKILEALEDDYVKAHTRPTKEAFMIIYPGEFNHPLGAVLAPGDMRKSLEHQRRWAERFNEPIRPHTVDFPQSRGSNVNMMPFRLFDPESSLPPELHGYLNMIRTCAMMSKNTRFFNESRVAYLTVHESDVLAGHTQRRAGLHIERPRVGVKNGRVVPPAEYDSEWTRTEWLDWHVLAWGLGHCEDGWPVDGIFIASNVSGSSAVYACEVSDHLADRHGALPDAARRGLDGYRRVLEAGELCWITDRTPHESLPVDHGVTGPVHRQFFRLVVGPIDAWYSRHNTPNPLGVRPPDGVDILDHDKFGCIPKKT